MKGTIFLVCNLFIGCLASVTAQSTGVEGKCPEIEYVKDLVPSKLVGLWHSVYETGDPVPCICSEFEEIAPGHYLAHFYHLNLTVTVDPKNVDNLSEGLVMKSKFNPHYNNVLVRPFATDYENYVGVYTCKEVGDVHYPKFALWSRTYTLSEEKVDEMKTILSKYEGIDVSQFKSVNHDNCEH